LMNWICFDCSIAAATAFDYPIGILVWWRESLWLRGFALGWLLVVAGLAAVALSLRPGASTARRMCGVVAILIPLLFATTIARFLHGFGQGGWGTLHEYLEIGVVVAFGGGVVLVIDP